MNYIYLTPYTIIEDKDFTEEAKIIIRASDFNKIKFQDGKMTFSFINCRFQNLEIENNETIDFKDISIQFISCFLPKINIETFATTNFSIFFGSSILQGRIANSNLLSVTINNCLLLKSLFLLNLNNAVVSYTEDNIFPIRWKRLLMKIETDIKTLLKNKQVYSIYDSKNIVFSFNENTTDHRGIYKRTHSNQIENKIGYNFTDDEKKKFEISLYVNYSADKEHKLTKIVNAKLSQLSIIGYSTGELVVENTKIDNWYIHNFSTQIGANFYNIKPFRSELIDKKFEIHKSNLDKVWFDNVSFDDFSIISLYRNKFGQTTITSCVFPDSFKGFDKFKTVENIHYPEVLNENYYKSRYETFLQLNKLLEASGNSYESQKLKAVSNEALSNISSIPFWDKLILKINMLSNNHGLSIKEPFLGTLIVCAIFYILYLWSLGRMFNNNGLDLNLFGYYFAFLDITHKNDFLVNKSELSGLSVAIDNINKIFVGFLIYQFIAAFRKYGKM